jgi:hypothetical protein
MIAPEVRVCELLYDNRALTAEQNGYWLLAIG